MCVAPVDWVGPEQDIKALAAAFAAIGFDADLNT